MAHVKDTPEDRLALESLVGQECVYKEKIIICLVRLTDVDISEWGVGFQFDVVPAPGFVDVGQAQLGVKAAWDVLGVHGTFVDGMWVSWTIVTGPDQVQRIKERALEHPTPFALMEIVNDLTYGRIPRPAEEP